MSIPGEEAERGASTEVTRCTLSSAPATGCIQWNTRASQSPSPSQSQLQSPSPSPSPSPSQSQSRAAACTAHFRDVDWALSLPSLTQALEQSEEPGRRGVAASRGRNAVKDGDSRASKAPSGTLLFYIWLAACALLGSVLPLFLR